MPSPSPTPLTWTSRRSAAFIALAMVVPFLFAPIPPLVDLLGHIGRYAIELAPADSPLQRYFSFEWHYSLNLGADVLIQLLAPLVGLFEAAWLIAAGTAALTGAGIVAVARTLNREGAYSLPWALIFVFSGPLLFGFVNFSLAAALSLLGFALWVRLERRPGLRAAIFLTYAPILLVAHAIGGGMMPLMIASWEVARRKTVWREAPVALARALWPLAACAVPVLLWRLAAPPAEGRTRWLFGRKLENIGTVLRDQNMAFDIASVAAAAAVLVLAWRWGARFRHGTAGPALALALAFLLAPGILGDADHVDVRILPFAPMLALALLDWGAVGERRRRAVFLSGAALLAIRLLVTTLSFAGYAHSYAAELEAVSHIRPGSRVLNLTQIDCPTIAWRRNRLDHVSALVTPLRQSWVNAHWEMQGVNLLTIRYRPSEALYRDPSQFVHPAGCIDARVPMEQRNRRTVAEVLSYAPVASADYLWLIDTRLPAGYRGPALEKIWSNGRSELYAVRAPLPNPGPTP